MKKVLMAAIFMVAFHFTSAQTNDIPKGYAVVVGAYSLNKVDLALKFTKQVADQGYDARFGINESKSLILVYIDHTESFKEAIAKMKEIRQKENYEDTWVHVKTSQARLALTPEQKEKSEKTTAVMKKEVVSSLGDIYAERFKDKEEAADTEEAASVTESNVEAKTEDEKIEDTNEVAIATANKEESEEEADDRLAVYFDLINTTNNQPVEGEVQIIDTERSKLLDVVESGQYVKLDDPDNRTGQMTVIVDVFGFRKQQKEFNYYKPFTGATNADIDESENGPVIKFELVRYRKGDIITMYNVFYFKDAAVMQPESKYEVNSLLNMLKENKSMRIKIHGHVNGKHPGQIISVDENNYFALTDNNPKDFGSAKSLSRQRAETIRDYLIEQGINADRMEIKAWGGKRMLHDKHSNKAKQNVRVEVEILSE
ncbi:OmpA family protein [Fulvivirga lutimaris]|uniref:OmpA family protein n=1 Tax=Fulvivirga lutimaris TaxID=1819566 RepID=UPI0012BC8E42|nr:OmpA family protein [Fulvivirga lutimaris]MTI40266.1 OmpA family protein [Fulvivirga lutimaris]